MQFSSPYLVVMNKCDNVEDTSAFPFESIPISAKNKLGLERLQREIFQRFAHDYRLCDLFIPYEKSGEYAKIKEKLIERQIEYTDEGQIVSATIPIRNADLFQEFIKTKEKQAVGKSQRLVSYLFLIIVGVCKNFIDFYRRNVGHIDTFSTVIANFIRVKVARFTLHTANTFPIV